jgi:hypothetical protein
VDGCSYGTSLCDKKKKKKKVHLIYKYNPSLFPGISTCSLFLSSNFFLILSSSSYSRTS